MSHLCRIDGYAPRYISAMHDDTAAEYQTPLAVRHTGWSDISKVQTNFMNFA